jgi:glyoxylase-like metal-dependent hydrolase (beta-lactamase superfamily II)
LEIVQGVHQIKIPLGPGPLSSVNAYFIAGEDGKGVLIDTGWDTPEAFQALVEGLRASGAGFQNIDQIVVTHLHADHYGLAGKIKQLSDARLCLHEAEAAMIEPRYVNVEWLLQETGRFLSRHGVPQEQLRDLQQASMPARKFVMPTPPDRVLKGGEVFKVGSFELEVILTPGHAPGHICLYERNKRLLFSGDLVLLEITPNVGMHPQSGDNPLADFLKSLDKVLGLEVNFVFPGHGSIFSGLRQRIGELQYHHQQRRLYITSAIRNELKTAYQIASELKWMNGTVTLKELGILHRRLAVMETVAHLQYLLVEGKVKRVTEGEIFKYWAGG